VNYTVTVTPLNGFVGQVNLSVSGLPAALISSAFSASTLTFGSGGGAQDVLLQLTSEGIGDQTYTFTVTGTTGAYSASGRAQVRMIPDCVD
jgi:hypothetical protein